MSPLFLALLVAFTAAAGALDGGARGHGQRVKSQTFLSPPIFLRPGSVSNKWYMDADFPRGHVALKSFNGELVDARGAPVPLHETYLHHWLVGPYYPAARGGAGFRMVTNSGVCGATLGQYFGVGAETRRTATWVPDPYGVEAGGGPPPEGYGEERWALNVHAIDTRGAADRAGCTECRCDLYNVTVDEEGYAGGTLCCSDQARCRVEEGFVDGEPRVLFLRYTVMWVDWSDAAVVPVRIYILDVADDALLQGKSKPDCKVEYMVEECSSESRARNECVDVKVATEVMPRGGDVVYAVGHQHARHRDFSARPGRAAAVLVDPDVRHRARGRQRGGLRRGHVGVLPGAGRRQGARRRGADHGVQLHRRAAAHGGDGPLLPPRGRRAGGAAAAAAAAGSHHQAAVEAVAVLQLPGPMVRPGMAVDRATCHGRR